jgi:1-acyl-sn-glycerol-3-phosphate acyltransferase
MGANAYVYRVELHQTYRIHHPSEVPNVDSSRRSSSVESLRSERDPPGSLDRDSSHRFTFFIASTLPSMLRTLLAATRTFVLIPLFFLLTLVIAAFIIVYGAFRPAAPIHDRILRYWSRLWLRIPPVRIDVTGIEKVDPDQRYVVVANHLSMFDIPLLIRYLPIHGRFLAKTELFKIPLVGHAMRTVGIIEIDRSKGGSSRQAIIEGVRLAAARGYSLVVFPEGTRGTEGKFLPFHKGAFRIAIDTGLPILPVVIEGTDQISKPGSLIFFPGHASLHVLDPIDTSNMTNKDDLKTLTAGVESEMKRVYGDLRHTSHD